MLIRKMLRDIQRNKVQFLAIFLMMFFGCFLFSGITGEWNGMQRHFDEFIEEQNLADYWAYKTDTKQGGFTAAEQKSLDENEEISEYEGRMVVPMVDSENKDTSLTCYFAEKNILSRLYVVEGESFDSEKKGIWLDALFAKANNYETGDSMALSYQGLEVKGEICGLVYSPEYIFGAEEGQFMPNHKRTGFAWISPKLLPENVPFQYNQFALNSSQSKSDIQEQLKGAAVIEAKDHPSVSMIRQEVDQHRTVGIVFSTAFVLIAELIAMTTMYRMLRNQKMQIGILKALGFTKKKLLMHYISHNVIICLLGAFTGYSVGNQVMPSIIYRFMKKMYALPVWKGYLPSVYLLLPLGGAAVCLVMSVCICRRYLKPDAAETLYGLGEMRGGVWLPLITEKISFSAKWNLRDIVRNKLRSFMSLCGVLGCTALLFCAFALSDTFTNLSAWTFQKQQTYQCKFTELPDSSMCQEILTETDGEYLMEGTAVIKENDSYADEEVALTVPESTRYFKLAENLDTFSQLKCGVALSKKTADRLGIKVGETITWKVEGSSGYQTSTVECIVRTPLSQGIIMMKAEYEKSGQLYTPTSIIGKEPEDGVEKYEDLCVISRQKDLTKGIDSIMEGTTTVIMFLVTGAVLLGSVMLYNLGVLSYLERYREFATMKVLGFADCKIRKVMIQQNVWLSALGILLGIPGGYLLLIGMLTTIPGSMDVPVYIKTVSWLLSMGGTLVLSWGISRIISRKIPRINMVEALKARE